MLSSYRLLWKKTDLFWAAASILVFIPCLYYSFATLTFGLPFTLGPDWKVLSAEPCDKRVDCLQVNDRVLSLGSITQQRFATDRTIELRREFAGGKAHARLIRDHRLLEIDVHDKQNTLEDVGPLSLFALIFWLMGTATVLFLRPRDERWLVLVLFHYVTALWFSTGLASAQHTAMASVLFHVFIWLFPPLTIHLHLILPNSLLTRWKRWVILVPLYLVALALIVLDGLYLVGNNVYVWACILAVFLSLSLLVLRLLLPLSPAIKIADRGMLFGMISGLGPFLLFFGAMPLFIGYLRELVPNIRQLYPFLTGASLVSMPLLPMSYIYAIYKHHLGALEFRANRLLGLYSFAAISATAYLVSLFLLSAHWAPINLSYLSAVMGASVLFVALTPLLRNGYQHLVDRHIFGIRHSPEQVIEAMTERIPTAFDRSVLSFVIAGEILPALLIRQSALYLFDGDGRETLYQQGLPPAQPAPTVEELRAMLAVAGHYLHPDEPGETGEPRRSAHAWVRLVIPLSVQAETIGVWLIGRRDPDDFYPGADIHLLSTVGSQIAAMVENIRLYERAQQELAQRKAAEEEIRRSEERFRTLFEATLEGIAIVRNGVILEVNHALLTIFDYPPSALIGHPLSDLVSVSETETDLEGVPREGLGFHRNGSTVEIEMAAKKYVFQGEDVTVVAIRDIARRKHDEAENKMLQRQLLHSQKMEAIGRLSAGVAHDFNNCLLAIFGYSDLLLDRYREDPFLHRNLVGLKEAGQKAAGLTKQLLAFARRQPMETRVIDLNPVVSGLEKMLQRLLGEDIHLVTELDAALPKVKVDPGQVEQVVVNLAVNARHAMPSGGRLTIRTAPVVVPPAGSGPPPPHANVPPGSYVRLTVADTGMGMDSETQARVFEPFFSTKGEGTGLGLSTAYGIVKQSGGHIFVDSAPGQGASFSIYLPVTREEAAPAAPALAAGADTGTETILLVEDEDEVRTVLHQILTDKGYRVIQAAAGDEALAMARIFRGTIHLLLTDVTMPEMKGTELATRLLPERPQMRVLFMSGYNDEAFSGDEPGWICLQKPFPAQTLTQTLRSVLDAPEEGWQRISIPA
jgi:PAS domain S-box-containing protein